MVTSDLIIFEKSKIWRWYVLLGRVVNKRLSVNEKFIFLSLIPSLLLVFFSPSQMIIIDIILSNDYYRHNSAFKKTTKFDFFLFVKCDPKNEQGTQVLLWHSAKLFQNEERKIERRTTRLFAMMKRCKVKMRALKGLVTRLGSLLPCWHTLGAWWAIFENRLGSGGLSLDSGTKNFKIDLQEIYKTTTQAGKLMFSGKKFPEVLYCFQNNFALNTTITCNGIL